MKYIYNPVMVDKCDPRIIEGYEIQAGAEVEITKMKIDPMGLFRFIIDKQGNRMSVCRNSLDKK